MLKSKTIVRTWTRTNPVEAVVLLSFISFDVQLVTHILKKCVFYQNILQ